MNFNVAELPAVRAQLERDVAVQNDLGLTEHAQHSSDAQPVLNKACYPSKRLALENGHYQVVDHDK